MLYAKLRAERLDVAVSMPRELVRRYLNLWWSLQMLHIRISKTGNPI